MSQLSSEAPRAQGEREDVDERGDGGEAGTSSEGAGAVAPSWRRRLPVVIGASVLAYFGLWMAWRLYRASENMPARVPSGATPGQAKFVVVTSAVLMAVMGIGFFWLAFGARGRTAKK